MSDKVKLTVTMEVTPPQAMFNYWNLLGGRGSSREVGFFVDGDGNFRPKCSVSTSEPIPEVSPIIRKKAVAVDNGDGNLMFDFDNIATFINYPEMYDTAGNIIPCDRSNHDTIGNQLLRAD